MRLAKADLVLLLDLLNKRSLDVSVAVKLESAQVIFTFGDVDGQTISVALFEADSAYKARVSSSEYLDVVCRTLQGGGK